VGELGRGDDGSPSPLIGRTGPVAELMAKSHLGDDEYAGIARSGVSMMLGRTGDAPSSPLGNEDDDACARLPSAAVVKPDHCAASHFGDDAAGIDGSGADMAVDYRVEVDTDATDLWLSGLKQDAQTLYI
jgi:hypothetical protein